MRLRLKELGLLIVAIVTHAVIGSPLRVICADIARLLPVTIHRFTAWVDPEISKRGGEVSWKFFKVGVANREDRYLFG